MSCGLKGKGLGPVQAEFLRKRLGCSRQSLPARASKEGPVLLEPIHAARSGSSLLVVQLQLQRRRQAWHGPPCQRSIGCLGVLQPRKPHVPPLHRVCEANSLSNINKKCFLVASEAVLLPIRPSQAKPSQALPHTWPPQAQSPSPVPHLHLPSRNRGTIQHHIMHSTKP